MIQCQIQPRQRQFGVLNRALEPQRLTQRLDFWIDTRGVQIAQIREIPTHLLQPLLSILQKLQDSLRMTIGRLDMPTSDKNSVAGCISRSRQPYGIFHFGGKQIQAFARGIGKLTFGAAVSWENNIKPDRLTVIFAP